MANNIRHNFVNFTKFYHDKNLPIHATVKTIEPKMKLRLGFDVDKIEIEIKKAGLPN
ncbi:hypothetical protein WN51_14262 [Melipona quadrifasciata]|uniref:Uncharacterized protein n=1 Tax=Melipona quadrifasciata TaxID=166423 RepID=A0A0M9A130_9HYME|nr:hypothetical protein WN51_14262 [Melipona quadrifasciata]